MLHLLNEHFLQRIAGVIETWQKETIDSAQNLIKILDDMFESPNSIPTQAFRLLSTIKKKRLVFWKHAPKRIN